MDIATMQEKLIAVLTSMHIDSGQECPLLTSRTKPVGDLPNFSSPKWLVATTLLSIEIAAPIPDDVNIFIDKTTKLPRSIEEIAGFVCEFVPNSGHKEGAAA